MVSNFASKRFRKLLDEDSLQEIFVVQLKKSKDILSYRLREVGLCFSFLLPPPCRQKEVKKAKKFSQKLWDKIFRCGKRIQTSTHGELNSAVVSAMILYEEYYARRRFITAQ